MREAAGIIYIDGKPARLSDVRREATHDTLAKALGDYVRAKDVRVVGVTASTLRDWKNAGKIRARKVGAFWYYSKQDLLKLIKAGK